MKCEKCGVKLKWKLKVIPTIIVSAVIISLSIFVNIGILVALPGLLILINCIINCDACGHKNNLVAQNQSKGKRSSSDSDDWDDSDSDSDD